MENGCKLLWESAPNILKFAPTQKRYQNFRLLTRKRGAKAPFFFAVRIAFKNDCILNKILLYYRCFHMLANFRTVLKCK